MVTAGSEVKIEHGCFTLRKGKLHCYITAAESGRRLGCSASRKERDHLQNRSIGSQIHKLFATMSKNSEEPSTPISHVERNPYVLSLAASNGLNLSNES